MKAIRFTLGLLALSLAASCLHAQHQENITFPSGDETAHATLYLPQGSGPHPAVVLIHEWWGVNAWMREQADVFVHEGYATLLIDLYRGKVADNAETAHELMRGLPQDQGVRDLVSAVHYLESRKEVNPTEIGAVGWCMGGGYAAQLAIAAPSLKAVAINYGALPTDKSELAKIHAAILGNFGAKDQGIPPEAVHNFEAAMKSLNKPVDLKIYPDAGHAFENPNNKGGYRPQDASDAMHRIDQFLASHLKH